MCSNLSLPSGGMLIGSGLGYQRRSAFVDRDEVALVGR